MKTCYYNHFVLSTFSFSNLCKRLTAAIKLKSFRAKDAFSEVIADRISFDLGQGSSTGAIRGDLNNLKNWGAILNNWGAISQLQILL